MRKIDFFSQSKKNKKLECRPTLNFIRWQGKNMQITFHATLPSITNQALAQINAKTAWFMDILTTFLWGIVLIVRLNTRDIVALGLPVKTLSTSI